MLKSSCKFTKEQLEAMAGIVSDEVLTAAAQRSNIPLGEMESDYFEDDYIEAPDIKLGFFGSIALALGVFSLMDSHTRRHSGHCNGDCAHCPPHYGYRYGRWYYGRGHISGCEFGGNKGDGAM